MGADQNKRKAATPQMRRLAASIARSTETARTLPGRLSRSLAPSREGRQRRLRNLMLMVLALLPFLVALAVMNARGGHGEWVVVEDRVPPWQLATSGSSHSQSALVGSRVRFERGRVRAEAPLACRRARYHWIRQSRSEVFPGLLPGGAGLGEAGAALDLPTTLATLRVDCERGRFDYHQAGSGLLVLAEGRLLRLASR